MNTLPAVTLRAAILSDAEAIAEIYNREVLNSTVTFDLVPRSLEAQRAWIVDHQGAYPAIVAASETGEVIGFASLSPYRDRPAYATTAEDSVYVHHAHRGQGVGRKLLSGLVSRASQHGFHSIIARVVGGHEASIGLHQSLGFQIVGVEREVGRKFGKWLDVVILQLLL